MEEEEIRVVWGFGVDWVVQCRDDKYSHRPEGDYGAWQPGIPPGTHELDIAYAFRE